MRQRTLVAVAAMAALLVACGGAAAPAGPSGVPSATEPAATVATEPTPAGEPTPESEPEPTEGEPAGETPAQGGGNGGFASRPCDVLSAEEAESAVGVSGLSPQTLTIDAMSAICSYRDAANQVEVYAGIWEREAAEAQWTTMEYLVDAGTDGIERVDGLGGDAILADAGTVLLVHDGGTVVQLTVRNPDFDEAATKAAVLEVGRAVLARI
jgi:hypothetical protein